MILALETATPWGGVALLEGSRLLAERELGPETSHAGVLLERIEELLNEGARSLDEVELIALSVGPGSFTGLRVGLATALGLCFGTQRRIVPVSTLAALSLSAEAAPRIVPLLDARKGQVYTGLYGAGGVAAREDRLCEPAAWFQELRGGDPLTLLGDGAERYGPLAREILGAQARILSAEAGRPRARNVGRLGAVGAGQAGAQAPAQVELRYLRRPEAEAQARAGHPSAKAII